MIVKLAYEAVKMSKNYADESETKNNIDSNIIRCRVYSSK